MIPKIIHYCWFGRGLMPKSQRDCIKGWKRLMPDWQFMRWDESSFPIDKYPLAQCACNVKRYALASDICRYNVLSEYGGVYLDTDVELFARLDPYLECSFFSAIELYHEFYSEKIAERYLNNDQSPIDLTADVPHLEILTSTMGCVKGQKMITAIRDYYNAIPPSEEWAFHYRDYVNNDRLVARHLVPYGFRYKDETQRLDDGIIIYGTGLFGHKHSPNPGYKVSYHHNAATWDQDGWSLGRKMALEADKLGVSNLYEKVRKIKKRICDG